MPATSSPMEPSFRDLALQAAASAKMTSFAHATTPNPVHAERVCATFAKSCPTLTRFATLCDTGVVKQFAFILHTSKKMAVLSCPFPAQGRNDEEVFAGSLGDSMEIPCPVTIRMKDVRGDVLSICETRAEANVFKLPTSESNPLEEEAPPGDEQEFVVVTGPERIGIELNVPTKEPCFVAIPKVFPVPSGAKEYADFNPTTSIVETEVMPSVTVASMTAIWYEAMRYGIRKLDNCSIQARDVLFHYESLEKAEFTSENRKLVSHFTTIVTYLNPEDELYHTVTKHFFEEKEKLLLMYGAKMIVANPPHVAAPAQVPALMLQNSNQYSATTAAGAAVNPLPSEMNVLLEGLAKAINDSSSKTLTGTEREKASEADDAKRFYGILFGSVRDVIGEDGSQTKMFVHATIQPLFLPVLAANKNSKATKAMHEAVETMAAELSMQDNHFASASNLFPRMFDQPLTAALRTGQWEYQHTVLNPEGIKTNFGIHHLAPPRTWTATYITRQQGELQLTQQEQVEEDKSRYHAKTTELYHSGCMGSISDIHEMIGNFFGLMNVIIEFDRANPPLLWTEIAQYVQILRSGDGKGFTGRHRNIKEVMFNIGQDVQSIIAGFVSEARKTSYKAAVKMGNEISPLIFHMAQNQANELRSRFTLTVLAASAGTYKDASVVYKLFLPEPAKDEKDRKKREAGADTHSSSSLSARNRPFATTGGTHQFGSSNQSTHHVTPNGSPTSAASLLGKTVFVHVAPAPQKLPHPGAIFPHPTRANQFTILCCRSAFEGRSCTIPACAFYHFPNQLTQVPRDLKDKLKDWVSNHSLVSWHADAANWATPPGNVRSGPRTATTNPPA